MALRGGRGRGATRRHLYRPEVVCGGIPAPCGRDRRPAKARRGRLRQSGIHGRLSGRQSAPAFVPWLDVLPAAEPSGRLRTGSARLRHTTRCRTQRLEGASQLRSAKAAAGASDRVALRTASAGGHAASHGARGPGLDWPLPRPRGSGPAGRRQNPGISETVRPCQAAANRGAHPPTRPTTAPARPRRRPSPQPSRRGLPARSRASRTARGISASPSGNPPRRRPRGGGGRRWRPS